MEYLLIKKGDRIKDAVPSTEVIKHLNNGDNIHLNMKMYTVCWKVLNLDLNQFIVIYK